MHSLLSGLPAHASALRWREIDLGANDLLAVCDALRAESCPWLLDSALTDAQRGRYSFAGADPWGVLRERGGALELEVRRAPPGGPPLGRCGLSGDLASELRRWLPRLPARCCIGWEIRVRSTCRRRSRVPKRR